MLLDQRRPDGPIAPASKAPTHAQFKTAGENERITKEEMNNKFVTYRSSLESGDHPLSNAPGLDEPFPNSTTWQVRGCPIGCFYTCS